MKQDHDRRDFLKSGAAGLAGFALFGNMRLETLAKSDDDPFPELVETTIGELQARMRSGQLTSRRIVEMYIDRIRIIDPKLRSVIEVNPDALSIADRLDRERRRGKMRSMLHGI